eukprot:m.31284 g.31284  ORF g.31284 m.31284 type:complete len:262 (+) comp12053_c0_seq1:100-885(+)
MANKNNLSTSGKQEEKAPSEWGKVIAAYLTFYAILVLVFATCYSVMYATLPDREDGPKTNFILSPGVSFIPGDSTFSIRNFYDDNADYVERLEDYNRTLNRFFEEGLDRDRSGLQLDASELPAGCQSASEAIDGAVAGTHICIFSRLNRVYAFNQGDVEVEPTLDFPSESRFEDETGLPFTTIVEVAPTVIPAARFNFRNNAKDADFNDIIVGVKINVDLVSQEALEENSLDFRFGVQFLYGQDTEDERDGFGTFEFEFRA